MAIGGRTWPVEGGHGSWRDTDKIKDKHKAEMKEDDDDGDE